VRVGTGMGSSCRDARVGARPSFECVTPKKSSTASVQSSSETVADDVAVCARAGRVGREATWRACSCCASTSTSEVLDALDLDQNPKLKNEEDIANMVERSKFSTLAVDVGERSALIWRNHNESGGCH